MAASCALGGVSVGGLSDFLPFLLKEISSQPRRQYLLLNSLKEVIRWGFVSSGCLTGGSGGGIVVTFIITLLSQCLSRLQPLALRGLHLGLAAPEL